MSFSLRMSVLAASFATLPAFVQAQVLQINSSLPDGSFAHAFLTEFKTRVEAELPSMDVQIFMGNTLGSEEDVLQGLGFGTHHASLSASAVVQVNPRTAVFDLPYLFENRDKVQEFAASPAFDMLAEGFAGRGIVLSALWDNGFRVITNSVRPIVTPEDLRGLKIRTPTSRQRVAMFNTLGANATPLSFGEVYSGLDQGVIDGQENPAQIADSARLYEVQSYMSLSNHVYLPTFMLFGETWLNAQTPEVRETVLRIAAETAPWTFAWGEETDSRILEELADKIAINEVDFEAFQAAALPLYDDPLFVDAIGADMIAVTREVLGLE
ncbi:tripartite ATP-independent transporter DctP family solute receptor [Roseinatronobacter thiooxidans]|uniref:Tripartite ATP-independent transporter DctP family solute receptor n=1 Tax=Roseinatronobacter thiooxidans TaxID=121821 RepID=A0A2W7PTP8_9RHOB|nr:TRAP transporter substrate-binding protein [Roseinatronobacter thiooxidans]PZX39588.1 tripartite ATP-independent transporter DctP family solute receptor [Roseinatronobacter thiooxidans]